MTAAKPHHLTARRLLLDHLDLHPGRTVGDDLDPLEAGIVGDTAHQAGGDSYHLGKDKIRARGSRSRYSVDESARDSRGLDNYASAMDIGYFKVTTRRGVFDLYDFNAWLIGLCVANDPDTADLREVIYSPDGKTVRRWDRLGRRTSGDDSHLTHTHLSEHRDASGARMVRLAARWLQHIGLIEEEDVLNDADKKWLLEQIDKAATAAAQRVWYSVPITDYIDPNKPQRQLNGAQWMGWSDGRHRTTENRILAALGQDRIDEQALAAALAPALVQAVQAADTDEVTPAELQQAIVGALRELAGPAA